jgi:protein-tyrosine phosphatase
MDRHLVFEGCVNFRDLGGYATGDGRRTRWGLLFRSDSLHRMTAADIERLLGELGVRLLIDLRAESEWRTTEVLAETSGTARVEHVAISDDLLAPVGAETERFPSIADMTAFYGRMLVVGGEEFGRAVRLLTQPGALPSVFYCSSGKDRTGVLAALVLSLVGVVTDVVVSDYELSARVVEVLRERVRILYPDHADSWRNLPVDLLDVVGPAFGAALDGIRGPDGSLDEYAERHGVSPEIIEQLRDALLE